MLLILNTIIDLEKKRKYDLIFSNIFRNLNYDSEICYPKDEMSDSKLSQFSHLLITGSELFASVDNENDKQIFDIIHYFIKHSKSVLGICYGHQILAKAILGSKACRKAEKPEFGWKKVKLDSNPLFEGIENPVSYESHYDEVCNLTADFRIIAVNDDCPIQAFQYKNRPVWGVQFHPEIDYKTGEYAFQQRLLENHELTKYFKNELTNTQQIEQNFEIFKNFIETN
ncbi:MAG: gamma-glutamyl-gamma-aminobutyrate hydrolase family protein [Armatimonadetes bacterium]|nr:gamma-glutamyl-gamma-aminobutyrate hydrolase family protein [Armatimonadota bacterium]